MNQDKRNKQFHWKRIHHSWIFWIFLFLMGFAIFYYVVSADFAFAPQTETRQPSENNY